jgi:hypothetical protein
MRRSDRLLLAADVSSATMVGALVALKDECGVADLDPVAVMQPPPERPGTIDAAAAGGQVGEDPIVDGRLPVDFRSRGFGIRDPDRLRIDASKRNEVTSRRNACSIPAAAGVPASTLPPVATTSRGRPERLAEPSGSSVVIDRCGALSERPHLEAVAVSPGQ